MREYRLIRKAALVEIFVDGHAIKTVSANFRNELRDVFIPCGLPQADIDSKVHELYITNKTSFTCN